MIKIVIPGRPVPKGRHQVRLYGRKVITYTPAKTREYEKAVKVYAAKQKVKKLDGDVGIIAVFYTSGPGDTDNLIKSLLDGLNGVAWEDDRQVKLVMALKQGCRKGQERTEVVIMQAEKAEMIMQTLLSLAEAG
ncbi:MAG: RusA family crossover junction endodeoxyribonuclease [Peptococcaceae bacterium]|nr:RusA family crossover junction endodeoxyribonuclease [Peptococcaceae bacterium]